MSRVFGALGIAGALVVARMDADTRRFICALSADVLWRHR